ncbi:hypothetical protein GTP55_01280 [Duganella sp. FT109W]|uniref:Uncharacterized protein n=1 Tax=Duganella margarita TaxID=2692170 RepID=A0ABW9WB09_9BURK|nr:hypothetical protein [Duganella margarita]MYN37995.1 hypothetical protein [Duganella margarita]
MGDEFLEKIKGFNRTLVVHSKNGPHAAAAAMGMMAAQSKEAGPYFRVSDFFIPNVANLAIDEHNIDSEPIQIDADFKRDWLTYLRFTALPACGLKYKDSCTPQKNTIRFLNAHFRRIPATRARNLQESRALLIPSEYWQDYEKLVTLIKTGGDLKPYLSRDVLKKKCPDKNDRLLNSWGIQHLHFRPERTDQLLFCVITESDVFIIQALSHRAEHLWVNVELFQILHDNWPAIIARGKQIGLRPEEFSAARRFSLRGYNANFPVTVSDGTVYLPPTGGTVASGDALEDMINCDKIFWELHYWQSIITRESLAIRTALNMSTSKKLVVRMAYDNRDCCFYEATRAIRLGGFAS